MNTRALFAALGALGLVLGIWVGTRVHSTRGAALNPHGIRVPAGEASAPNPSDLAHAEAAPEGAVLAGTTLSEGALPPARIPRRLPQFSLENSAGKSTPIGSFSGKSLVINFWATWCAPCRKEIPLLETLHSEWTGRDVSVVGIAVDTRDKVLEFANRFKINYPLLIGDQDALDAAAAFGVASPVFPFTVFTDSRGEVVALYIGELHKPQAELILSQVHGLNQDLVQLPEAQRAIAEGLRALAAKTPG
jgi:thiol-disulfide isomerase/thioredoxin